MLMPAGGHVFADRLTSTTFPFQLSEDLIVVQVELNGKPFSLILDTGMPFEGAVLFGDDTVDSAGLAFSGKMLLDGVGGQPVPCEVSPGAALKVPNLTLTDQLILVMPRDSAGRFHLEGKDGIIGLSFFAHFVVHVDYGKRLITLSEPGGPSPAEEGQRVPAKLRDNRIFVPAEVQMESGPPRPVELVLDTGNRNALVIKTGDELRQPEKTIPVQLQGLTAKISRKMGRIGSIDIGGYRLEKVLAAFTDDSTGAAPPWEKEGNLGNQILGRFDVTFDIPGGQIFLKKNGRFDEPFEFNMAGLQVERKEDRSLAIINIIPGSPADEAHLAPGDRIVMINDTPASRMTRDAFDQVFGKDGSEVILHVDRSGQTAKTTLKLRRII